MRKWLIYAIWPCEALGSLQIDIASPPTKLAFVRYWFGPYSLSIALLQQHTSVCSYRLVIWYRKKPSAWELCKRRYKKRMTLQRRKRSIFCIVPNNFYSCVFTCRYHISFFTFITPLSQNRISIWIGYTSRNTHGYKLYTFCWARAHFSATGAYSSAIFVYVQPSLLEVSQSAIDYYVWHKSCLVLLHLKTINIFVFCSTHVMQAWFLK